MAFNTPLSKANNYVFGRGVMYFAPFDANGVPMGERDLGNVPGWTLNIESEKYEHLSSRVPLRTVDLSLIVSVTLSGSITIEDFSAENQALLIAGEVRTLAQSSTPIVGEVIPNIEAGREYQLGTTDINPSGVRNVAAVTVNAAGLVSSVARVNTTAYVVGDIFKVSTNVFAVKTAGTTAGSAPTHDVAAVGNETTDGSAVVVFLGTTAATALTTDYTLSPEAARIAIVATGPLGKAAKAYTAATGSRLSLTVGYTPVATTREQMVSSGNAEVSGALRFIADNAKGDNRDVYISSVTLSPEGEIPFITENEVAQATLAIGVSQRNTSIPQVIIDGRSILS